MDPQGFRLPEDEFRAWHAAVAARSDVRGLAAIAMEMEAHVRKASDGHVAVQRHQLFTWAEAIQGAATRDPRRASEGPAMSLVQVVADLRAVLGGKSAAPAADASRAAAPARLSAPAAPVAPARWEAPPPAAPSFVPPVVYGQASGGVSTGGGGQVFSGPALAEEVRRLVRGARRELLLVTPWATGLDGLAADVAALPREVQVRIVSRLPERQDEAYHRGMDALGKRRTLTAFSPQVQTRFLVVDGQTVCLGAAGVAATREVALVTSDPSTVKAMVDHFERVFREVAG